MATLGDFWASCQSSSPEGGDSIEKFPNGVFSEIPHEGEGTGFFGEVRAVFPGFSGVLTASFHGCASSSA